MSKIELPAVTGNNNTSRINDNFKKIEDALNQEVLYRKGYVGEPNEMETNLDMNGKEILNVATGTSDGSLVTKSYVDQGLSLKFDKSGGPLSGPVDMQNNQINNLPNATQPSQPATYAQLLQVEAPGDSLLRNELAAPGGAGLVGFQQSGTGAVARTAESKLREIVSIKDFGAKGDGVTDDTAAKNAMISALGYLVIPEGVFMVDRVACDGVVVGIFGTNRLKSILKSLPGSHTHTVEVSNDGGAVIRNITIDQNESTQPAGHGVRSGGCSILDIANTTIQNCAGYGVGLQGGTSKGVKIDNVLINNVGLDGVDVKDYNLNNEVVQINNLTVRNYGNRDTVQVAVDIRGIVNLTNLVAISDNNPNNSGFRFRSASAQGRVGSGTASNIYFKGTGAGSLALQISQNVRDYSIHGVEAEGSGFLAQFEQGSAGYVSGLVGRNLVTEGCTIFSDGLTIDGLIIKGATRGFDLEPTAKNNRITNFKLSGITGANFCRVQSGAENNQLVNGIVEVGKSTGNVPATTKTIIQNVTNFKTLYKGISNDILVDSVGTKTFVFTHGLDVAVAPDLSSIRTQVVASTSGGQNAVLGPVVINSVTSTQIEIMIKVITASPTVGAAIKVAIEASKYNGHP